MGVYLWCVGKPEIDVVYLLLLLSTLLLLIKLTLELANLLRLPADQGNLPFSTSTVLRLEACNTMPGFFGGGCLRDLNLDPPVCTVRTSYTVFPVPKIHDF